MNGKLNLQIRSSWILIAILSLSVVLRVIAALYLGDQVISLPGTNDQLSYHNLALRLLGGYGFSFGQSWWPVTRAGEPTAHWSFLYTFYLTFVYSIFGPHPLAARLIQAVIVGILQPLLAYLIGKRVFSQTVGLISAGITAIYIYFIYYASTLMTEPFYITSILASLYVSMLLAAKASPAQEPQPRIRLAISLGLLLAAAVLLRQLFLLCIPFLFGWLWWAGRRNAVHKPFRPIWIASLIIVLSIIPFTIFNYQRFNRFVLLNTNAGYAFFWGNNPIYGTKFVPILTEDMGSYQELIPRNLLHLDEAALDQALLKQGIQFVLDDPLRYILLSISRIPSYFMFWPTGNSGLISNVSRVGSFGLFLPFMLYGLVLALTRLSKNWRDWLAEPAVLLLIFMMVYSGIHILTWTLIRYRLPVDAVLIIFAGLAIEDLARRLVSWRYSTRRLALDRQS